MIKIKILFYIKSIKYIKYMFVSLPTPNILQKNKILNILKRQILLKIFLNGSRSKP